VAQEILDAMLVHACFAEIQASYAIDGQTATPAQEDAFAQALRTAGEVSVAERLRVERLIQLQGAVFTGRPEPVTYGLRLDELFVGSRSSGGLTRLDYPCPPPRAVGELLRGVQRAAAERLAAPIIPPTVFAAVVAFGFGFIHPLMEGNGRIHRFLVHAALAERGVLEPGTVIPVSAAMLSRLADYDQALRAYCGPVRATAGALAGVPYILEPTEPFSFPRYERVAPLYRYPVLTEQVAYLERALKQAIDAGLIEEAHIAEHLAEVRAQLAARLALPAERLDLLIRLIRQDGGTLSRAQRRAHFPQLSEDALLEAQAAVSAVLPRPGTEDSAALPHEEAAHGHSVHNR
jgi:hypothetical protein